MKKMIAFDLDDTLNITKSPVDDIMADLLRRLLDGFQVCVISGTNWELLKKFCIDPLVAIGATAQEFANYHILPTTGTQYWRYVSAGFPEKDLKPDQILEDGWLREYANFLNDEQVKKISDSLERAAKKLDYWCANPTGEIIENRQSQVTMSALGQWATPEDKHAWDPDQKKRKAIVKLIKPELGDLGVQINIGGGTSIDVTLPGIDKAYGMRQLMKMTGLGQDDILFIGDKLQPGGNDYPVREMGVDVIEVTGHEDTNWVLRGILAVS